MASRVSNELRLDDATAGESHLRPPLWKRFLDVTVIVITAPAWAPIVVGIGAAIKLVSPGPVLFRQERVGLGGQRFVCLKFRSMQTGASTSTHENHFADLMKSSRPMKKLDAEDRRLIRGARILRASGLDELPQLFNVLRGEMSLIGPRPCTPQEYNNYTAAQKARFGTLPGLTGLWQVSGKNKTTFNEMIALDIRYLETLSFWRDVSILLRTPVAVLEQVAETVQKRKLQRPSSTKE